MQVRVSDIVWDTEQEDGTCPSSVSLGLPNELTLETVSEDGVADFLSDAYGYCVKSFSLGETHEQYALRVYGPIQQAKLLVIEIENTSSLEEVGKLGERLQKLFAIIKEL